MDDDQVDELAKRVMRDLEGQLCGANGIGGIVTGSAEAPPSVTIADLLRFEDLMDDAPVWRQVRGQPAELDELRSMFRPAAYRAPGDHAALLGIPLVEDETVPPRMIALVPPRKRGEHELYWRLRWKLLPL